MVVEKSMSLSSYRETLCLVFHAYSSLEWHLNELTEGRCYTLNHETEYLPPSNPLVEGTWQITGDLTHRA